MKLSKLNVTYGDDVGWSKVVPTKPGLYWFYGHRPSSVEPEAENN